MPAGWAHAIIENARARCKDCRECPLASVKREPVWGEGRLGAELCIIVDRPGDKKGRILPVAEARSLKSALRAGNVEDDQELWLTCAVRCPGEDPGAAASCSSWLEVQLRAGRPKVVVAAGPESARFFTDVPDPTPLAGTWLRWRGHHVLPAPDFFTGTNGVAYLRVAACRLAAIRTR